MEEPVSRADGQLRCLWYRADLPDTLTDVDEFLNTAAGTAALADFYRIRDGSPIPESEARALIDAVGVIAAKFRAWQP